jgi:hypothetical protein
MNDISSEIDQRFLSQETFELQPHLSPVQPSPPRRPSQHDQEEGSLISGSNKYASSQETLRSHVFKNWRLEAFSAVLSVLAFVGLIVVLATFNGKDVTSFHHSFFTPNGIVAILTTIIRVAMLVLVSSMLSQEKWSYLAKDQRGGRPIMSLSIFDSASRGAWGSAKFLFSRPNIVRSS